MNRAGHAMAVAVLTAMILGSGVAAGSPISSSVSGYPGGGNGAGVHGDSSMPRTSTGR